VYLLRIGSPIALGEGNTSGETRNIVVTTVHAAMIASTVTVLMIGSPDIQDRRGGTRQYRHPPSFRYCRAVPTISGKTVSMRPRVRTDIDTMRSLECTA